MKRRDDPARKIHPHAWLWEPLESEATFLLRAMFGAKAIYLDGRNVLCFCAAEEPWRGLLVPTERRHHDLLCAEFPALSPHPILGKWLYLPETADSFERDAAALVRLARARDPRMGITPTPRPARRVPRRPRRK